MAINVKPHELRKKSKAELAKQLTDLKNELSSLRVQKVASGTATKVAQIRFVRKAIARVLTVMSHTQREELKKVYAGKKYIPTDLRAKKTRAIRRQLTKFEATRETVREHKKKIQCPVRKYAIKA